MKETTEKYIAQSRAAAAILFCSLLGAVLFAFILSPSKDFSVFEKRALARFPRFSLSSIIDGSFESELEKYLQDQFPLRNLFVGIGSYFDAATGKNGTDGIYRCSDGYFVDEPVQYDAAGLEANLNILNDFAQSHSLDSYMMIVPSAGYVLSDKLPRVHRQFNDGEIISSIYREVGGCFKTIDLCTAFQESGDLQIYYKTDHHWTSAGANLAGTCFLEMLGISPVPPQSFFVRSVSGFRGTTYSKAAMWLSKPDNMEFWSVDGGSFNVALSDTGKKTSVSDSLFFEEHLAEYDMYPAYLDGNHGLTVITNNNVEGGSLLMLKDSYANAIATILANSFRTIVMADLRHYRTSAVSELIGEHGIDSLLVVYGIDNIINDSNIMWLR